LLAVEMAANHIPAPTPLRYRIIC